MGVSGSASGQRGAVRVIVVERSCASSCVSRRACAWSPCVCERRACVCATVGVVRAAVRVGVTASLACRRERTGCCMCVHVTVTVTAALHRRAAVIA